MKNRIWLVIRWASASRRYSPPYGDLLVLSYAGGRDYARWWREPSNPGAGGARSFSYRCDEPLQVVDGDYRVFFNINELPKLYEAAGLKIVRCKEPLAPANFTKETLRLVRLAAQKL